MQWREIILSTNDTEKTGSPHIQKFNLDMYAMLFIKINLKWIIDLNIRAENLKLLEGNKHKSS